MKDDCPRYDAQTVNLCCDTCANDTDKVAFAVAASSCVFTTPTPTTTPFPSSSSERSEQVHPTSPLSETSDLSPSPSSPSQKSDAFYIQAATFVAYLSIVWTVVVYAF
ncbi:hypothetical protein DPMN_011798 [Dreissena polymorpha]|uniref:Uncharacterized protein n=1 Tax=Dreissena polymorpha TaxID=45954 RepID=A0A9D4N5T7_DREPO|nr:hypothetical protein DPMN_011798 [Dreissena polymorpha]